MIVAMAAILLAGAGNFAMHRWMLDSGHPLVALATAPLRRALGRNASYVLEYLLLVGALVLAQSSWFAALCLYGVYTALNAATVGWLKGRPGD